MLLSAITDAAGISAAFASSDSELFRVVTRGNGKYIDLRNLYHLSGGDTALRLNTDDGNRSFDYRHGL
jgi:hypothetical protein